MTRDALLVVQAIFTIVWRLFTSWTIPGTNATPAAFYLFLLFASFGIRVIKKFFGDESG